MKRLAVFVVLCILAAAMPVGMQAWQWRERKLVEDERDRAQAAAENAAAGRLGLKTPPLPPHPLDRRAALDDALRLDPDRRFLLAAKELSGAEVAARFADGRWILSAGSRDFAQVAELPGFAELMKALSPLARDWVAAAKVSGSATRARAVRGHKEAFADVREAQARWARGDHRAAVLHDAASAAASLILELPRTFDADDRLDAHAIALSAADAAAGADTRDAQAVLALALGYAGAARALVQQDEPALHALLALDHRKLSEAARRKEGNAGERDLLLRWLMQDADERGVARLARAARNDEHVSIPAVGLLLLDPDLQLVAAAADALPLLALAELEGVHATAPNDVELVKMLMAARNSALQNVASGEDVRGRLARALQQADTTSEGPLWRGADTGAWYAAATAAGLLASARSGYVLRDDPSNLSEELGAWPVPPAAQVQRWLKAKIAADRGNLEEASEALRTSRLPGPGAAADLLDTMARQAESPDPRMIEAARAAQRHFDSRPSARLLWARVLRSHGRDADRAGRLIESAVADAAGAYPLEEIALATDRGQLDKLGQLALDDRLPFPARLQAATALSDRGANAQAERALRRLARERSFDIDVQEKLIRALDGAGRPADAVAAGLGLLRSFGDDDSFLVARARCAVARQLDAMGRHQEALATVERALPTEAACAYRIASLQLAWLGRKDDAEGLLIAYLARHPQAETVATAAEVRWRLRDDAGAAEIVAHPAAPVALARKDFRELGDRFGAVFRGRPAADVKRPIEALLKAGLPPQPLLELGAGLARAGAAAQAFEVYALLREKLPENGGDVAFRAWSALRAAKGATAAASWLHKQLGPEPPVEADEALVNAAYGDGLDEALWELFPQKPADPELADRLLVLRAASLVRRGDRGPRRSAVLAEIADPLAPWKARLARYLGLSGAYASWEVRVARYLLGQTGEEEIADEAVEGARPCEAPYYFALRAAAESRAHDAAAWYRVELECRNPRQPELIWAQRAASHPPQDRPPAPKPLHAVR